MKRRVLLGLDLFTAVGAIFGAAAMFQHPTGDPIGMSFSLLERTPFPDWRLPAVLLLACNAVVPLAAAVGVWSERSWGFALQFVSGALLLGWLGGQLALLGLIAAFQPVMLAIAAIVLRFSMDETHPLRSPPG